MVKIICATRKNSNATRRTKRNEVIHRPVKPKIAIKPYP